MNFNLECSATISTECFLFMQMVIVFVTLCSVYCQTSSGSCLRRSLLKYKMCPISSRKMNRHTTLLQQLQE